MSVHNRGVAIALTIGLGLLAGQVMVGTARAQEIYKTVDENGNVVYTDQKPSDDAEPVTLPELTVVDPVELGDTSVVNEQDQEDAQSPPEIGVEILSPANEETIWNTAYRMDIEVQTSRQLPPGAELVYLIDGEPRARSRSTSVSLEQVWRGTHTLQVEVRNEQDEVLGSSEPLTFFMRQHSRLHPNPD